MGVTTLMGKPQTNRELAGDGCISTAYAAKLVGMPAVTIRYQVRTGLVEPTRHGEGKGTFQRWNIRDVTALYAIRELREQGISLQACRKVQRILRALGKDFASATLVGFSNPEGGTDVLIVDDGRKKRGVLLSLLAIPGQVVMTEIALSGVSKVLARKFRNALSIPTAKRGRPRKTVVAHKPYAAHSSSADIAMRARM